MLKKLLLLTVTISTLAACNVDDKTGLPNNYVYLKENTLIVDGKLQGSNLHFYGTSTVTDDKGGTFVDKGAYFEFAGLHEFTLYMHKTRFAAGMPGVEMRLSDVPYTAAGDRGIAFEVERIIPEALPPNTMWGNAGQFPVAKYEITDLDGTIDNLACRVSFTCAGIYRVVFEGSLIGPRNK